jgi:hypothetical protein
MINSIRAEAERHFSPASPSDQSSSPDAANLAKLTAFRAASQIKDAARKAVQRQERLKKRII